MEFFKRLSEKIEDYDLQIVLQKTGETISVSVFPKIKEKADKKLSEKASKIKPLVISGTPEELDNGFFEAIEAPINKLNGLFTNSTEFVAQVQEVKDDLDKDAKKEAEKKTSKSSSSSSKKPAAKVKEKTLAEQAGELIKQAGKDFKAKEYAAALAGYEKAKALTPKDSTLPDKIMSCKVKIKAAKDLDQPDEKVKSGHEKSIDAAITAIDKIDKQAEETKTITNPDAIANLQAMDEAGKDEEVTEQPELEQEEETEQQITPEGEDW